MLKDCRHPYRSSKKEDNPVEIKTKNEEETDEEIPDEILELLEIERKKDRNALEDRGILFINTGISKPSLAKIMRRLLVLHFDTEFTDDIQLIINSPGGYCDAGWALIDMMGFIKNKVNTVAIGEICSMATVIFVAGDYRTMSPNSGAMIHQFNGGTGGSYPDLVANRKIEDMEAERLIRHFILHSKYKTETDVKKHLVLDQDNWLSPKEMKKHGLCDELSRNRKK